MSQEIPFLMCVNQFELSFCCLQPRDLCLIQSPIQIQDCEFLLDGGAGGRCGAAGDRNDVYTASVPSSSTLQVLLLSIHEKIRSRIVLLSKLSTFALWWYEVPDQPDSQGNSWY